MVLIPKLTDHDSTVLEQTGRVLIRDAIDSQLATQLHDCLKDSVPWTLAYQSRSGAMTLSAEDCQQLSDTDYQRLLGDVQQRGQSAYSFIYDSYMMIPAYLQQRDPGLMLNAMTEQLNQLVFLNSIRDFTGDAAICRTIVQATRYRRGHFLTRHNDLMNQEDRRYAFVLGLSHDWQPDYGGMTHFYDQNLRWVESIQPGFNQLLIFKVPVWHSVGMVTGLNRAHRYSLTGWFAGPARA